MNINSPDKIEGFFYGRSENAADVISRIWERVKDDDFMFSSKYDDLYDRDGYKLYIITVSVKPER